MFLASFDLLSSVVLHSSLDVSYKNLRSLRSSSSRHGTRVLVKYLSFKKTCMIERHPTWNKEIRIDLTRKWASTWWESNRERTKLMMGRNAHVCGKASNGARIEVKKLSKIPREIRALQHKYRYWYFLLSSRLILGMIRYVDLSITSFRPDFHLIIVARSSRPYEMRTSEEEIKAFDRLINNV